jgi:intracellular sulfur oxidation DsrE/DsrF family protein
MYLKSKSADIHNQVEKLRTTIQDSRIFTNISNEISNFKLEMKSVVTAVKKLEESNNLKSVDQVRFTRTQNVQVRMCINSLFSEKILDVFQQNAWQGVSKS